MENDKNVHCKDCTHSHLINNSFAKYRKCMIPFNATIDCPNKPIKCWHYNPTLKTKFKNLYKKYMGYKQGE